MNQFLIIAFLSTLPFVTDFDSDFTMATVVIATFDLCSFTPSDLSVWVYN